MVADYGEKLNSFLKTTTLTIDETPEGEAKQLRASKLKPFGYCLPVSAVMLFSKCLHEMTFSARSNGV